MHLDLLRTSSDLALRLELLLLGDHLLLLVAGLVLALVLLLISCLDMLEEGIVHRLIRARSAHALIINLSLNLR